MIIPPIPGLERRPDLEYELCARKGAACLDLPQVPVSQITVVAFALETPVFIEGISDFHAVGKVAEARLLGK